MHKTFAILTMFAIGASVNNPVPAIAASKHNGACVGFAGSSSGYKYAGIKCYLDTAPGDYVIRAKVMERNDPKAYRSFARLPKHPIRCTLIKGGTSISGGMERTSYQIKNC